MSETKQCPFCMEDVRADALLCKHCRSELQAATPAHEGTCPYCKEAIHPEAQKCKHCQSNLSGESGCGCGSNSTPIDPALLEVLVRSGVQGGQGAQDVMSAAGPAGALGPYAAGGPASGPLPPALGPVSAPFDVDSPSPTARSFGGLSGSGIGGIGDAFGFPRRTLPSCGWRQCLCGSSLPGYPPITCWYYCCTYPNGFTNCPC